MLRLSANPASFRSIVGDGVAPQRGTLPTTLVRALRGAKGGSFAKRFAAILDFCHNLASDFPQYIGGKEFKKMKITNIKCAVVAAIISLGFASQAVLTQFLTSSLCFFGRLVATSNASYYAY